MFTEALFTIARTRKRPRCPPADERRKKLEYMYTMEYYSAIKKECIWISFNEVDEPRAYYTEWSKSEREKQISYINTYIWNLEGRTDEPVCRAGVEMRTHRTDLRIQWGKERVRRMERVAWEHTPPYVKQIANGELLCNRGSPSQCSVTA